MFLSLVQISWWDPSYLSLLLLCWAPGQTKTQRKLHPRFSVWCQIVVVVAMEGIHSVCHTISMGVAVPTPSRPVDLRCARSGFLCIDTSERCVHHPNPQHEPYFYGKYRAPLCAVVNPIYTSGYNSYTWYTPGWHWLLPCGAFCHAYYHHKL